MSNNSHVGEYTPNLRNNYFKGVIELWAVQFIMGQNRGFIDEQNDRIYQTALLAGALLHREMSDKASAAILAAS